MSRTCRTYAGYRDDQHEGGWFAYLLAYRKREFGHWKCYELGLKRDDVDPCDRKS